MKASGGGRYGGRGPRPSSIWYSGAWRTEEGIRRRREAARAEYRKGIERKLKIYIRRNNRLNEEDARGYPETEA